VVRAVAYAEQQAAAANTASAAATAVDDNNVDGFSERRILTT